MSRHRLSILRDVAFVTLALAGGFLGLASSAEAEDTSAAAEKTSVELRLTLISASVRWSKVDLRNEMLARHANRSLYIGLGAGVRVFIKQPHHGLLVDFDYRIDTDVDTANVFEHAHDFRPEERVTISRLTGPVAAERCAPAPATLNVESSTKPYGPTCLSSGRWARLPRRPFPA